MMGAFDIDPSSGIILTVLDMPADFSDSFPLCELD
jgi:hypothetical protein